MGFGMEFNIIEWLGFVVWFNVVEGVGLVVGSKFVAGVGMGAAFTFVAGVDSGVGFDMGISVIGFGTNYVISSANSCRFHIAKLFMIPAKWLYPILVESFGRAFTNEFYFVSVMGSDWNFTPFLYMQISDPLMVTTTWTTLV